jgi:hypothetical protein
VADRQQRDWKHTKKAPKRELLTFRGNSAEHTNEDAESRVPDFSASLNDGGSGIEVRATAIQVVEQSADTC